MRKRLFAYITAVLLALSCITEREQGYLADELVPEGSPVTVLFSVPDVKVAASTKTLAGGDGNITGEPYLDPDMVYLVVCGHSQSIKYIRKAELLETIPDYTVPEDDYPLSEGDRTVTLYRFKVQLEISDSDRTVHFLGNVDENQLITGSYAHQTLPALLSLQGKQAYWQRVHVPRIKAQIDPDTKKPLANSDGSFVPDEATQNYFRYIPLIRNYAKLQVSNDSENFKLHSYSVIYYPEQGAIVPFRYNSSSLYDSFDFNPASEYSLSGYERCSFDDLDNVIGYTGNLPTNATLNTQIPPESEFLDPTGSDRVILYDENDTDAGFYIYERGVPTETLEPTFIIICGKFEDDDNWYYYRLDLMETKVENNQTVSKYYPIYRNFRYNIQVHRITSEGLLTPSAAAISSSVEDISADVSMRHLADISNGVTRLVVEPFMTRTYSGPADDGYYELYARFFDSIFSDTPNTSMVAVRVELEPMEGGDEDILILYDGNGNPVPSGGFFFPEAVTRGGVEGIRVIRFNTKEPGDETKSQKIKITGHNPANHADMRLYREVDITLQKRQEMELSCVDPLPATTNISQVVGISIPSGLPQSMFPLEFLVEPEDMTLTPDNSKPVNLPVVSGRSIATRESVYKDAPAIQFIRTLTRDEYKSLPVNGNLCTFYCYFKPNTAKSATSIWVYNEYFHKECISFENGDPPVELGGHFFVYAVEDCTLKLSNTGVEYRMDDGEWKTYTKDSAINVKSGHKVSLRAGSVAAPKTLWNTGKFTCTGGKFKVGGDISSLLIGDDFYTDGESVTGANFIDFFKGNTRLVDAYDLILPMKAVTTNGYKSMFDSCTSLVRAPQFLPATTLGNTCYRNMFYNCTSLEYAPDLPATSISNGSYQRMFWNCSKLSHIKMLARNWRKDTFVSDGTTWCAGVAAEGEIWLDASVKYASNWSGTWGTIIPEGWTVKYVGIDDQ